MKLSLVATALASLCLLHAGAFPVSEEESPAIIGPARTLMKTYLGEQLFLNCEAYPKCENDLTLIYWLVNGSFPEDVFSDSRVVETKESSLMDDTIIQKGLFLKRVVSEDLGSTFVCVVTNPTGVARKHVTLSTTRSGSDAGARSGVPKGCRTTANS